MDDLAPLIDAGFGISLQRGTNGKYECLVTTPEGDALTESAGSPQTALNGVLALVLAQTMRNLTNLAHVPA
jgi:hypothetical protein